MTTASLPQIPAAPLRICEDLIFDVGLHCGEDAAFYLKLGYRVVGFEADPYLVQHCRTRFQTEIAHGRLSIVEGAIAAPGMRTVTLYRYMDKSDWNTTDDEINQRNLRLGQVSQKIECRPVDFAQAIQTHGLPHYMKIDVEGAERMCLEPLISLGAPTFLSVEAEKWNFDRLVEQMQLLKRIGYRRFAAVQQQTIPGSPFNGNVDHVFRAGSSGPFGSQIREKYLDYDDALQKYRRIFILNRLFGGDSFLMQRAWGRQFTRVLSKASQLALDAPLPGWYDIHTSLR